MEVLIALTLIIFLPLAIAAGMHFWIGNYPEPYPKSSNSRREIIEVFVLWVILTATSTAFLLTLSIEEMQAPTAALQLNFIAWMVVPWLVLPLAYVVYVQKWTLRDLSFVLPRSWPMVVFALALFAFAGVTPLLEGGGRDPLPWSFIAIALYQPAFIEEFVFRVVIQGKLERALGQTRSCTH